MINLDSILKSRDITLPTKVHIVKSEKWKSLSRVRLFETPWTIESMEWILQVRILEWVAYLFSSRSSRPRNSTGVSCISGRFFTNWFIREAPYSQSYGFPVVMYGCEKHKESWVPKNWCFWTVVLGKTLESPLDLDCKEIKPANPKGNQSWIFIGRTDTEAEAPIFCHLMWRTDSSETTLLLGKIEGRKRRGWQRMRWLDGITDSMDMSMRKL